MLKGILENAIGRKVTNETFKLASDMTTEDIIYHHIRLTKTLTYMDYVMRKLAESVLVAERIHEDCSCKDIKKDSLQTA